jgi:crotonobetainyl-CoA:carnitine CoA-transferase CaiB-like acyl-CoA transferase
MAIAALEGVRVVELGEGVSAAFCAKLFGDYGAEVIKIEKPAAGDTTRHWGPYPDDIPHPEKSGTFFTLNTNKQSVTLDVDTAKGRELLVSLISTADVLIENYMPQQMKDWGLDYASLSKLAPNMIMISITPFGQTGPYANWKAYDLNTFHLTGAGSRYCGRQGEAPLEHGTYSAEYYGAYVAATWGLASVFAQDEVGGEHIDVSCAEAIAATFVGGQNIGGFAQDGVFGSRTGVGMPLAAPATILPCKDGHVWMLALEAAQWHGLVNAMGNPDWAQLEMFDDMFTRAQNSDLIYSMMIEWTMQHSKQDIMDLCQQNNCPSTAVYNIQDAAEHPHMRDRNYVVELEHPVIGRVRDLGAPVRIPDCPGGPTTAAPLLGQHNEAIYREKLGLSEAEYRDLQSTGVI